MLTVKTFKINFHWQVNIASYGGRKGKIEQVFCMFISSCIRGIVENVFPRKNLSYFLCMLNLPRNRAQFSPPIP